MTKATLEAKAARGHQDAEQRVTLGSGDLYVVKFAGGAVPEHRTIEVANNLIGGIKGGAELSYKPTIYAVKDDKGVVHKVFITDTEVIFKSGILTWNNTVLNKLSLGGELEVTESKSTLKLGKVGEIENYLIRFVHTIDKTGRKYRVTIVGTPQNGFVLPFNPEEETVIDAEFVAGSIDKTGVKLILEEEITPGGGA
ncbi:TPA: hypothetical protein I9Z35_002865 [Clostridium perfringens]|nr:hypothetical protein [Clostridium perfringens]